MKAESPQSYSNHLQVWPYAPLGGNSSTSRQRLLIIGPLPPPYSGPEIGTELLLQSEVLHNRFQVGHINTTVRSSNSEKGQADLTMVFAYVAYLIRLLRALILFRPRVVVYRPTSATLIGWVRDGTTLVLAAFLGSKLVLQFGGGHFRYFFDSLGVVNRKVIGWLLGRAALILAESRSLRSQFSGLVPAERVGDLPTAIPDEFFEHFEDCRRLGRTGPLRVLFVGHLSQAKGYCDILKAIPFLAERFNVRFQFIGADQAIERNIFFNQMTGERIAQEVPDEVYAEYIEGRGLDAYVEFLGDRVFGAEKLRAFEQADVFILPSYSEGFSRAILEAMAAGLPAVVTRVGAAPDIIDDGVNAFIVDPGNVKQLEQRLEQLLQDGKLRSAMGAASRELCRQKFRAEIVAQQLADLVTTLESSGSRSPKS